MYLNNVTEMEDLSQMQKNLFPLRKKSRKKNLVVSGTSFIFALGFPFAASAQNLNFDAPAVEQKKDSPVPKQVGPVSNINLGGAIDWRAVYQRGAKRPYVFIHVNEFVVSANVGEHIAISAEQLLLTSELGSVVGQDHGFVVVNLVQLPFLPTGMGIKLGRFRGKFGLDAQVDSPANIFPSQAVRSNGLVTDLGVSIDYAFNDFEFFVEAFNGPDYKSQNGQKTGALVDKPPLQARFVYQPVSNAKIGISGFYGQTWDNQVSPSALDMGSLGSTLQSERTIERQRIAVDASYKFPLADVYAEGIYGRDTGRLAQPVDKKYTLAKGALLRTDVPLFRISNETRTKVAVQYDAWQDGSYNGTVGFVSGAFSVQNDEGWTARLGGTLSDSLFAAAKPESLKKTPWNITSQLLVTF